MKKVLLATTALTLSAGVAAADVSFSGSAEMGVVGGNNDAPTRFHNSTTLSFSASSETDAGITVGMTGRFDMDGSSSENDAVAFDNETMYVSGAFGKLTLGDTDGGFDWAMQEVNMVGSIADDETAHAGFSGNAGLDNSYNDQVLRYEYKFGDFSVAGSAEVDDTGADRDAVFGLGAKWSGDMGGAALALGFGYQTGEANDIFGASAKVSASGFDVVVNYSDLDGYKGNDTHMAIGAGYTMDAISLHANYGVYELAGGGENTGFGLAAAYDLGGGAAVHAAFGSSDEADGGDDSTWSLGVAMSF